MNNACRKVLYKALLLVLWACLQGGTLFYEGHLWAAPWCGLDPCCFVCDRSMTLRHWRQHLTGSTGKHQGNKEFSSGICPSASWKCCSQSYASVCDHSGFRGSPICAHMPEMLCAHMAVLSTLLLWKIQCFGCVLSLLWPQRCIKDPWRKNFWGILYICVIFIKENVDYVAVKPSINQYDRP